MNDPFPVFIMFHVSHIADSSRHAMISASRIARMPRFRNAWPCLTLLLCLVSQGGCRLCADCDPDAYAAYGGTWQRTNRDSGRVGSVFDPGGSRASDLAARANAVGNDARDRARYGDNNADESDAPPAGEFDRDDADPETRGGDETIPDMNLDDSDAQEMRERFRNLELQDIKVRDRVPAGSREWQ